MTWQVGWLGYLSRCNVRIRTIRTARRPTRPVREGPCIAYLTQVPKTYYLHMHMPNHKLGEKCGYHFQPCIRRVYGVQYGQCLQSALLPPQSAELPTLPLAINARSTGCRPRDAASNPLPGPDGMSEPVLGGPCNNEEDASGLTQIATLPVAWRHGRAGVATALTLQHPFPPNIQSRNIGRLSCHRPQKIPDNGVRFLA